MLRKTIGSVLFLAAILMIAALLISKQHGYEHVVSAEGGKTPVTNANPSSTASFEEVQSAIDDKLRPMRISPLEAGPGSTTDPRARRSFFQTLVKGSSLDARAADALLRGHKFDEAVDALARSADAQSMEQTNRYKQELTQNLQLANQGLAIQNMACSGSICMAAIQDSGDHFSSLMAATTSMPEDLPMSSAIFHTIPDPLRPGASIQRVIFSNNPQVRSISVPR